MQLRETWGFEAGFPDEGIDGEIQSGFFGWLAGKYSEKSGLSISRYIVATKPMPALSQAFMRLSVQCGEDIGSPPYGALICML